MNFQTKLIFWMLWWNNFWLSQYPALWLLNAGSPLQLHFLFFWNGRNCHNWLIQCIDPKMFFLLALMMNWLIVSVMDDTIKSFFNLYVIATLVSFIFLHMFLWYMIPNVTLDNISKNYPSKSITFGYRAVIII